MSINKVAVLTLIITFKAEFILSNATAFAKEDNTYSKNKTALYLISQKKFNEAIKLLNYISKKNPEDVQVRILLARTLLKVGQFEQAYFEFTTIPETSLSIESYYDFGIASLRYKDYKTSLDAFKKIPTNSSLFDLASYYSGISAYRLGDYPASIDYFDAATVLPANLSKIKTKLRSASERKLLSQQKKDAASIPVTVNIESRPPLFKPRTVDITQFDLMLEKYSNKETTLKNTSLNNKKTISTFHFSNSKSLTNTPNGNYHLLSDVFFKKYSQMTGSLYELFKEPENQQEERLIKEFDSNDTSKLKAVLRYDRYINQSLYSAIDLGAYITAADFSFQNRSYYSPYFSSSFINMSDVTEMKLSLEIHGQFSGNGHYLTEIIQRGYLTYRPSEAIWLSLGGRIGEYSYIRREIDGNDWDARADIELGLLLYEFVSPRFGLVYETNQGKRIHNNESPDLTIRFNEDKISYAFELALTPLPWLEISSEFIYANSVFAGVSPNSNKQYFKEVTPSEALRNNFSLRLNKDF